jgi:hypothetical protein
MNTTPDPIKPQIHVFHTDNGVQLTIQTRPDGPVVPIPMSTDTATALIFALCAAIAGHVEHRKLIDTINEVFRSNEEGSG